MNDGHSEGNGKERTTRSRVLAVILLALLLALIVYLVNDYLAAPPAADLPTATLAPMASAPADLTGSFTMAKSVCEGQARIARKAARGKSISEAEQMTGEQLYSDMKEAWDGCIDALEAGVARQFSEEDDVSQIEAKLSDVCAKRDAFMAWNATAGLPKFFDANPLNDVRAGLSDSIRQIKTDDMVRMRISITLAGARLTAWESLGD